MKPRGSPSSGRRALAGLLSFACLLVDASGQEKPTTAPDEPAFSPAEIEQLVAPVALHPDDLLAQILIASTYPLEVVEAARWTKVSTQVKGAELTKALEAKKWDASVKSLVQFPQVLDMMDQKLDWMQRLGNAFLAQQKDVMAAVQRLRQKAKAEGHLASSKEQDVKTEGETIVIESASPDTVYVPVYNPTVVYGTWPYPAWPPYYYCPPHYHGPAYGFGIGIAIGVAWGYAWGGCHWGHSEVDIDIDRNVERNREIRDRARQDLARRGTTGGKGSWQHDPSHRRAVSYGDYKTSQRYQPRPTTGATRDAYRGRTDSLPAAGARDARAPGTRDVVSTGVRDVGPDGTGAARPSPTGRGSAFQGSGQGSAARAQSVRGSASRGGSRGGGRR
jgi:hypothetical protein